MRVLTLASCERAQAERSVQESDLVSEVRRLRQLNASLAEGLPAPLQRLVEMYEAHLGRATGAAARLTQGNAQLAARVAQLELQLAAARQRHHHGAGDGAGPGGEGDAAVCARLLCVRRPHPGASRDVLGFAIRIVQGRRTSRQRQGRV